MTWDPSCLSNLKDKNFKIDEEDEILMQNRQYWNQIIK